MLRLYTTAEAPAFPWSPELFARMRGFLKEHKLLALKPCGPGGLDAQLLCNELLAFGFDAEDIQVALNSGLAPGILQQAPPDLKDRARAAFAQRMSEARQRLVNFLLLNLPAERVPTELGGSKPPSRCFVSDSANSGANDADGGPPLLKPNERKPRRWKTQGDATTVESAEAEAALRARCEEIVQNTQLVSQALVRPLVDACNLNPDLCYETAVTSPLPYVRGCPGLPNLGEKPQNTVQQLRQAELKLIQASGFEAFLCTQQTEQKQRPKCAALLGLESFVVKYTASFPPYPQMTLVFQLQNVEDLEEMRTPMNFKTGSEQPLAVDGVFWKQNLQFRGAYPLVLPFIDLESKQLSGYGKAVVLKQLYAAMRNKPYNKQPILQALLALNEPTLEQQFEYYEQVLQQSIQESTLNTRKFKKEEIEGSFFLRAANKAKNKTSNKVVSLSPLLFACKQLDQALPRVQTTLPEGSSFLFVEDQISQIKEFKTAFVKYEETDLEIPRAEYNPPRAPQISRTASISAEAFKDIVQTRDQQQYKNYLPQREQLPVYQNRVALLQEIKNHQIMVVTAETGTGKSSNIPQLLVEAGEPCRVLITQPRKIAAISLAQRVATESGFQLKKAVGYSVKGQAQYSDATLMLYCTIGVIVRKIVGNASELLRYSHIIVDEVHERDINTDMFLGILKNMYEQFEGDKALLPKLIIMSATIDGEKFGEFFKSQKVGRFTIKGKTFQLQKWFLDDLVSLKAHFPNKNAPKPVRGDFLDDGLYDDEFIPDLDDAYGVVNKVDEIDDSKVNNDLIRAILQEKIYINEENLKTTLVFLPGAFEIQQLQNFLQKSLQGQFEILQCHAMLSLEEQQKLFKPSQRKRIILATNIAEASITIPDVIAVIDSGLERHVTFNPKQRKHTFTTKFISKESAQQRAGRAGRICDGNVFCCFSESSFDSFDNYRKPEMVTGSLFSCVMQLSLLSAQYQTGKNQRHYWLSQPHVFLQSVPDKPSGSKIALTLKELIDNDFMTYELNHFKEGEQVPQNSGYEVYLTAMSTKLALTPFGARTAFLPIEPSYGKILKQAEFFGANMEVARQLVACLSVGQNQILKSINQNCSQLSAYSDHVLLVKLLRLFEQKKSTQQYGASYSGLQSALDTYWEMADDDASKPTESDIWLANSVLQTALHPNVAIADRNHFYKVVSNPQQRLKVHNSSLVARDNLHLVFFNEQLQTNGQNYAVGCSKASAAALLFSMANSAEIDFRRRTIVVGEAEFKLPPIQAAVVIRLAQTAREFGGEAALLFAELMRFENQQQ